jgi:hypothetical protein
METRIVGQLGLDYRQEKDYFLLHNAQTRSGAPSASYPLRTGDKAAGE